MKAPLEKTLVQLSQAGFDHARNLQKLERHFLAQFFDPNAHEFEMPDQNGQDGQTLLAFLKLRYAREELQKASALLANHIFKNDPQALQEQPGDAVNPES